MPYRVYPGWVGLEQKKTGAWHIELCTNEILDYLENLVEKKYAYPYTSEWIDYVGELEDELNQCDSMPSNFWEWLDENYKDMKSWKTIEKDFYDKESIEYEVESGYMIDEQTVGTSYTTCFGNKKELAIEEFNDLSNGGQYHFVELVERFMKGEDCECSDNLMEWYSPDFPCDM